MSLSRFSGVDMTDHTQWHTGYPVVYSDWCQGFPTVGANQKTVLASNFFDSTYCWKNIDGSIPKGYICEKEHGDKKLSFKTK
jgi:hypothetical protein